MKWKSFIKDSFVYYNSFWGFGFEAVLNFTSDTTFENILTVMNDLFRVKQFLKYMYIYQDFFPLMLELFISWLEACGDIATDKCYCKNREDIYFPSIYKKCQVTLQMNPVLMLTNQASKKLPFFFFLIQKMWFISLKNTFIFNFLIWWYINILSLVWTQVNEHLHLIFY